MSARFIPTLVAVSICVLSAVQAGAEAEETTGSIVANVSLYSYLARFQTEVFFLSFIFMFISWHITFKRQNELIAKSAMATMLPLFRMNFAQVGDNGAELAMDAPHEYIIYLTGRRNVASVHGSIKLRPRQDLIRTIMALISTPAVDTCTFNVTMRDDCEYSDGVFAIVPKDQGVPLRNRFYDLLTFTKASNQKSLDSSLIVLTESNELTEAILPDIATNISKAAKHLDYFVVSDQPARKPETLSATTPPKRISLSFRLPTLAKMDEILPLIQALMDVLDTVPNKFAVTSLTKTKFIKAREEAQKNVGKKLQAERAKELEEKRLREKKEQEANLSPEAQRKLAAKEEKRSLKKRQKVIKG